jgi:hypothetical protein
MVVVGEAQVNVSANLQKLLDDLNKARAVSASFIDKAAKQFASLGLAATASGVAIAASTGKMGAANTQLQAFGEHTKTATAGLTSMLGVLGKVALTALTFTRRFPATGTALITLLLGGSLPLAGATLAMGNQTSRNLLTGAAAFAMRNPLAALGIGVGGGLAAVAGISAAVAGFEGLKTAIKAAREEAARLEEQMKALREVRLGLQGVTGGVTTPFALLFGTGGDIRSDALEAATALLPRIAQRMGNVERANQALALALRQPAQAWDALRLAGVRFNEAQLEILRNARTSTEIFEAQRVIIQVLQEELALPAATVSGWRQLGRALTDLGVRFMTIEFHPLRERAAWAGRVFDRFMSWSGLNTLFDMVDRGLASIGAGLRDFSKYLLPSTPAEEFEAYQRQIDTLLKRITEGREAQARLNDPATTAGFFSRLQDMFATIGGEASQSSLQRVNESADYQRVLIQALGTAYLRSDEYAQQFFRTLEIENERIQQSIRPLRDRLRLLQQSFDATELLARQQPALAGLDPNSEQYTRVLTEIIQLMRQARAEESRISANEIQALGQAFLQSDLFAQQFLRTLASIPGALEFGTAQLRERVGLMQQSANRAELQARMELQTLVTQGMLTIGSAEYNRTLAERTRLYRTQEREQRRLAQAGQLTVFERENIHLQQQVQLFRFGNIEMEARNRLLTIELAAAQRRQPLTEAQRQGLLDQLSLLREVQRLTGAVNEATSALFNTMGDALAQFASTGKFKFKEFAENVIQQLVRISLQAFVIRPLLNIISGFTNPLISNALAPGSTTSQIQIPRAGGFAEGGSFQVPGSGGGDRPYLIGLSPGEQVKVTPKNGTGGAGVTVINNVNSSKNFDVQSTTRTDSNGQIIVEQVFTEVMKKIGQGDGDSTFGARFGMRPRTVQR